jgi:exonuclease III
MAISSTIDLCGFDIMSFNVRGIQNERKRRSIFRFIKRNTIDICLLQETYGTAIDENLWKNQWGGDIYFSHGAYNARGTMILVKPN